MNEDSVVTGAALFGALITFLGLIISKENKTSEFRQAWIDSLRREVTELLTSFNQIADLSNVAFASRDEKIDKLTSHMSRLNSALFSVSLRLNPKEKKSQRLIDAANELMRLIRNPNAVDPSEIRPLEQELQIAAKDLLKFEWKRVKRGEPFFFIVKWVSLFAAIVFALIYCLGAFGWAVTPEGFKYIEENERRELVFPVAPTAPLTPRPNPPKAAHPSGGVPLGAS